MIGPSGYPITLYPHKMRAPASTRRHREIRFCALPFAALFAVSASASNISWTGTTDALWSTGGDWVGGVAPTAADVAFFDAGSTANLSNTLGADFSIQGLRITTPGGLITIGGVNSLALGAGGIDMSSASQNLVLDAMVALAANQSWNVGAGRTLTMNGAVSGGFILNKIGPGDLILGGANTYTGTTTIGGGTLTLNGSLNGTTGTDLTFAGTGVFNVSVAGGVSQGMKVLSFSAGDGTVRSTNNGGTGTVSFTSRAARVAGATGNFSLLNGTQGAGGTNNIAIAGETLTAQLLDRGLFYNGSSYAAYDSGGFVRGLIYGTDTNAPASIAAGGTFGAVDATMNVQIGGDITAQTTASVNTISDPGAFNITLAAAQTLGVNGILKSGGNAAVISGGSGITTTTANNDIVIRTDVAGDTLTISTPIFASGTSSLTKSGAGTLVLSGTNTYTGGTSINAGVLSLGSGTQALGGSGTVGSIGAVTFAGGALQYSAGNNTDYSGKFTTVGGNPYRIDTNGRNVNFASPLAASGSSGLTKSGAGTLTISAASTYTGPTLVTGGTLLLSYAAPVSAGMNAWFDASKLTLADGAAVAAWNDLSGAGHNATSYDSFHQPVYSVAGGPNGLPVVKFIGTNSTTRAQFMPITGDLFAKEQWMVMRSPTSAFNNYFSVYGLVNTDDRGSSWLFESNAQNFHSGEVPDAVYKNGTALSPAGNFNFTTVNQFMIVRIDVNDHNPVPQQHGLNMSGAWRGNFELAELISYDHVLSTADANQLGSYLSGKYGITSSYASAGNASLVSSPVTISPGATLDINGGSSVTIGGLGGSAGSTVALGGGTLKINSAVDSTFSGNITATGGGGLVKAGAARLTFSGTSDSLTSTSVTGGTLLLNSALSSPVNVASGTDNTAASLGGNGTITGNVTLGTASNGRINRITGGDIGTVGTLSINGSLSFGAGAIGYFDNAGNSLDYLALTGNLTAANGTVIQVPSVLGLGTYPLIGFTGGAPNINNFLLQNQNGAPLPGTYLLAYGGNVLDLMVTGYERIWGGAGASNDWSGNNWSGAASPAGGDIVTFTGSIRTSPNNDNAAGTSTPGITFDTNAASFTLNGNGITMAGGIRNKSASDQIVNMALELPRTSNVDTGSANVILNGIVSGAGALNKIGSGTLVLTNANSRTGATTLTEGAVSVASIENAGVAGNLGAASGVAGNLVFDGGELRYTGVSGSTDRNFTINTGKTATWNISQPGTDLTLAGVAPATTGGLTKTGAGRLTFANTQLYTGATNVTGGSLQIGAGGTLPTLATSGITLANNGNVTFNHSDTVSLDKLITGTGSFTKNGSGVLTISREQTYTGETKIAGGVLKLQAAVSLAEIPNMNAWFDASMLTGTYTNGQTVATWPDRSGNGHNATYTAGSFSYVSGDANGLPSVHYRSGGYAVIAGTLFSKEQYIVLRSPDTSYGFTQWGAAMGNVSDQQGYLMGADPGTGSFWAANAPTAASANGVALGPTFFNVSMNFKFIVLKITGAYSTTALRNYDLGMAFGGFRTTPLDVAEIISYSTVLNSTQEAVVGGYLAGKYGLNTTYAPATNGLLPVSTSVVMSNDATFDLNSQNQQIASLAGTSGAIVTNSGSANDSTLTFSGSSNAVFSGVISNGSTKKIALVKNGPGTQSLAGANTYTGATIINEGTLQLGDGGNTGSIALGSIITDNGTLAINRSNTATQSVDFGLISGTGGFTQAGSGTTIFNLANTYAGST